MEVAPRSLTQHLFLSGSILNVTDLVLTPPNEIARKCKISLLEAKGIVDLVCKEISHCVRQLEDAKHEGDEKCTTGDTNLDDALGGGIRTGMIWEVVGERYAFPLLISRAHSSADQFLRQDPTSSSAFLTGATPQKARWFIWLSMLFDYLFEASHVTTCANFRDPPFTFPFIMRPIRYPHPRNTDGTNLDPRPI